MGNEDGDLDFGIYDHHGLGSQLGFEILDVGMLILGSMIRNYIDDEPCSFIELPGGQCFVGRGRIPRTSHTSTLHGIHIHHIHALHSGQSLEQGQGSNVWRTPPSSHDEKGQPQFMHANKPDISYNKFRTGQSGGQLW